MRTALIFFAVFPFLQILPLKTYNQPYAFLMAFLLLLLRPRILTEFPQRDRLVLIWLVVLGIVLFAFAMLGDISQREVQYLLAYISPVVLTTALYYVIRHNPERFRQLLIYGIIVWVSVSLVQRLFSQDFLLFLIVSARDAGELAANIQLSGRGTLGLAPEPTHHGFQMLVLATCVYLLRGPAWVVALALFDAVLLALSSSALAALGLGGILWTLMRIRRWWILGAGIALLVSTRFILLQFLDQTSRIGLLLTRFLDNTDLLLLDASVNARFYGMVEPLRTAFNNGFLPFGMAHETWLDIRSEIMSGNPWVMFLSGSGPASGYGLILLHAGLFALPVIYFFFRRLCWDQRMTWAGFLSATGFIVFLGQLYLSTPSFGLLLAVAIYAHYHLRDKSGPERTPPTFVAPVPDPAQHWRT